MFWYTVLIWLFRSLNFDFHTDRFFPEWSGHASPIRVLRPWRGTMAPWQLLAVTMAKGTSDSVPVYHMDMACILHGLWACEQLQVEPRTDLFVSERETLGYVAIPFP